MVPRPAHSAALVTALQIPGEKFGVRRQAVSRATPLFRRSTFSVGRSAFTKRRRGTPPGRADACPSRLSASPYTAHRNLNRPFTGRAGTSAPDCAHANYTLNSHDPCHQPITQSGLKACVSSGIILTLIC